MRGASRHIVDTASMAGWLCPPLLGVYNVSKHGVVALTETLYHDLRLAKSSIGVSVLCPGFVPTGIAQSERNRPADLANAAAPSASQSAANAQMEKDVSSGKMTAAEVAQLTFDAIRTKRFYVFTHRADAARRSGPLRRRCLGTADWPIRLPSDREESRRRVPETSATSIGERNATASSPHRLADPLRS